MSKSLICELLDTLKRYLSRDVSFRGFNEWLEGVDWNDSSFDPVTQLVFGEFELLITDVYEGFRPESELKSAAREFVADTGAYILALHLRKYEGGNG